MEIKSIGKIDFKNTELTQSTPYLTIHFGLKDDIVYYSIKNLFNGSYNWQLKEDLMKRNYNSSVEFNYFNDHVLNHLVKFERNYKLNKLLEVKNNDNYFNI